jgi:hypothetical protein
METIGDKLPAEVYVEVQGVLTEHQPMYGIGLKIISFRDVDAPVKAELAEWKRHCEEWQDSNSPDLMSKTHGAQITRITRPGAAFAASPLARKDTSCGT